MRAGGDVPGPAAVCSARRGRERHGPAQGPGWAGRTEWREEGEGEGEGSCLGWGAVCVLGWGRGGWNIRTERDERDGEAEGEVWGGGRREVREQAFLTAEASSMGWGWRLHLCD